MKQDQILASGAAAVNLGDGLSEDLLHHDPLLDCLVELTRIHGRAGSRAALTAGLPLSKDGLTPSMFGRAAARAGFSSKVVRRSLDNLDAALLPVVLLLYNNEACLLLGWDDDGKTARLLFPETGQGGVTMSREELALRYVGIAIFARPHFRFDQRTPEVGQISQRHWFWGALIEQWPVYKDILYAALLVNIFALAMPLFSMNVYDRVVPNFGIETLWMLSAGMLLVLVLDYVLRLLRGHFMDLASARIDVKLSALIMEKVLGMRMVERPASVGSYAANLRSFESIRDFVASATVTAIIDLPFAILFLVVILWISWPLVFIPILMSVILMVYSYIIQQRMQELSETTFRAAALRNATLVESLTALETIKAQGAEGLMQEKWEKTASFLARTGSELRLMSSSVINGTATLQQFSSLITVIAGVYLIHERMLTMGGLIACSMLMGRALAPLAQMAGLLMQYQNAKLALGALETTMTQPTERGDFASFVHRSEILGAVEFRDVTFSYREHAEPALKNVSFSIKPGEHVVILGKVGSGKTTVQKLLLGLYAPGNGAVLVDGIDLRQLDPADLRRNIGYVGQDAVLFYGSLRENITIGAPYADDRALIEAADIGGLTEFVNQHAEGFDMLIGERGDSLSGGQRQGVAIARAVLLDPPILLLDEPTSAMDYSSEAQFKDRLVRIAAHKTLIIVTHRSSLIDLATRLIVLDNGRVVADGPRDQVIEALKSGRVGRAI